MANQSESPKTKDIKHLEALVTAIKEVTGCRIVTDSQGEIAEIHVTADTKRLPRLVARDVDTLLKVKAGLTIDHRKIGVVIERAVEDEAPAQPAPAPEMELAREELLIEEEPATAPRIRFDRVAVVHEDSTVRAEVTLSRGESQAVGQAQSADTPDGHIVACVKATLDAMLLLHDCEQRFSDPLYRLVPMGREDLILVYLTSARDRDTQSYSGAAVVRQDPRQAAVLATLSALNRVSERWGLRSEPVAYEITS